MVSAGSGKNAAIEGYAIGGKTATSPDAAREAPTATFPLLWDLPRRKTQSWLGIWWSSTTPRASITAAPSRPRCSGRFLKISSPISGWNGKVCTDYRDRVRKPCVMGKRITVTIRKNERIIRGATWIISTEIIHSVMIPLIVALRSARR